MIPIKDKYKSSVWIIPLLPLIPGLLWPGVVAPDMVLSMVQI